MWKKNDPEPNPATAAPTRTTSHTPEPARSAVAVIGPTIVIRGDLSGDEDLLINGTVEGKVSLGKQHVTIGKSGRLKADVHGKSIRVEGEVVGDLFGSEEVEIREAGRVEGNISAPRVTLEKGALFKGSIDMSPRKEASPPEAPRRSAEETSKASASSGGGSASGGSGAKAGAESKASEGSEDRPYSSRPGGGPAARS